LRHDLGEKEELGELLEDLGEFVTVQTQNFSFFEKFMGEMGSKKS